MTSQEFKLGKRRAVIQEELNEQTLLKIEYNVALYGLSND